MFIAGTRTARDWLHNVKIPLQRTDLLDRYRTATDRLSQYPDVNRVVGHSMGGSVALALARNNPQITQRPVTYGAPVVLGTQIDSERHRDLFDPVSVFDLTAAQHGFPFMDGLMFPHSYKGN